MTQTQTALAIVPHSTGLTAQSLLSNPTLFETYQKLAQITAASQLSYGKATTPEAVATKQRDIFLVMLKGLEIGMMPMQALDSIDVIAGKPALKPQGMLAQIKSRKLLDWMKIDDDGETCTVTMKRKDEDEPYVESFGMADADKMVTTEWENGSKKTIPLSQKANWKAQAKTMRKWRAVAACCRIGFPDVIQGMYTPEELGADVMVSDDGDMVTIVEQPSSPSNGASRSTSTSVPSANGLGQKGGPLGRDEKPTEPPPSPEKKEGSDGSEEETVEVAWCDDIKRREYIVSAIKGQTGDQSLTWELVKTLVPGEPQNYGGKDFAQLAVEGWRVKQKPADTKSRLGGKKDEEKPAAATPAHKGDVIVDQVRYLQAGNQKYLEFCKGDLRIRRYDRSGTFRKEVGDEYYGENGFETMVPMSAGDEPYSINPLQILWESKGSYNTATMCVPVTNENVLDAYFGNVDFPEVTDAS